MYSINPDDGIPFDVYCDQTTAGGGWTVIQKRFDGSVDFHLGWADYRRGFGYLNGEFWLGLDKINRLTKEGKNRIRVELTDTEGNTSYADYNFFAVASERVKYRLSLGTNYSGERVKLNYMPQIRSQKEKNGRMSLYFVNSSCLFTALQKSL